MCIALCVDALVSLQGMGRAKFRTLEDLYLTTDQVSVPTQVPQDFKEGFHLQSTKNQVDGSSSLSMVSKNQPFEFEMEEKSRTSYVCATWCSSCMHFERVAAIGGVGADDFTDKTYEVKRASQCSSNDSVLFSSLFSGACSCGQHMSSEASNILGVSLCHDTIAENAESQGTFKDSNSCKDIALLSNISKAQPARDFGDTPKGLTKFDNHRFSNELEKHKKLEILGDDISCISRSEKANLVIGNHNGGPDRKNVSCGSTSDDSCPVVEKGASERLVYPFIAGSHFNQANGNHCDAQNFIAEPPLAGVAIPNRSDRSDISSLKDFYDCAISVKGEPSECSNEQVKSSLARAAISGLGRQIDDLYSCDTFVGVDPHSYCKKHLQKSVSQIKDTSTQESWQSQPAEPRGISDLMDDEVRVCDICGDAGREDLLAICNKCTDGAEHIYCMHVKLDKVPKGDWMCEECMLRSAIEKLVQGKVEEAARILEGRLDSQKSEISINPESKSSRKLKFRSSCAGKSGTKGASSTSPLSAKRHGVPLEVQSVEKLRVIGMSAVPPRPSNSCNNSLMCKDFSGNNFKNEKLKAAKDITSMLQISSSSQEKAKVLHVCGDKRHASTLEAEMGKKRTLETRVILPNASKPSNQSLSREPPFKTSGKVKTEATSSVSSMKQSSYGTQEEKLSSRLGDKSTKSGSQTEKARIKCSLLKSRSSKAADLKFKGQLANCVCLQKQKLERNLAFHGNRKGKNLRMMSKSVSFYSVSSEKSNSTCSEVLQENSYCPVGLKNSSSAEETKTAKGKEASALHNPAMCLIASDSGVTAIKGEKKSISSDETFFSGSNRCKLDTIQSSGRLNYRFQPSIHNAHKDVNYPNEEKKIESWQAGLPTEASMAMKAYDERSQFEAAILYEGFVIPNPDFIWLGKFQIHSEGVVSTYDGIQACLSICASPKVLEVVDRLPEIIILEELTRLRMWPSQLMENQASEENIALYFFAKDLNSYRTYYNGLVDHMTKNDLALKGNLDGVDLLIFPSSGLPEKSQRWNKLLFLWGVFRGQKVNNSANTTVSNSQKLENGVTKRSWALDLNAYPQDGNDMVTVDEIGKLDSIMGTSSSGDRILLDGDSYNSCSCSIQALDKGGEKKSQSLVLDLNLSLWPKSATSKDDPCRCVWTADDKTNEDLHGKLPMDDKNGIDNVEPSRSPYVSVLASPTINHNEENMDLLERQAVDTLVFISKAPRKI